MLFRSTAKRCERTSPIPRVRADVEYKIAGSDEVAIQTSKASLAERDSVIDGQRSHEAHAAVEAAHLSRSLNRVQADRCERRVRSSSAAFILRVASFWMP